MAEMKKVSNPGKTTKFAKTPVTAKSPKMNAKAPNPSSNVKSRSAQYSGARSSGNFMQSFSAPVTEIEGEVENFLTKEPLLTVGVAIGVGLLGGFLFKKYRANAAASPSSKKSNSDLAAGASVAFAGFLTKGLSDVFSKVESEFGAFKGGGIADVRDGLTSIITDGLTEKPFETIATAVGAGFGIANLEVAQVKQGAIRIAKTLAVRTLEGSNNNNAVENQGENYVQA